jgi:hypothetical protein
MSESLMLIYYSFPQLSQKPVPMFTRPPLPTDVMSRTRKGGMGHSHLKVTANYNKSFTLPHMDTQREKIA